MNVTGVDLTGFEHVEMLANVEDRLHAGFSEREIEEIRYQESQLRAISAKRSTAS